MEELQSIIVSSVLSILGTVLIVATNELKKWISEKIKDVEVERGAKEAKVVKDVVVDAVRFIEQVFKHVSGKEKLMRGISKARLALHEKGLSISDDQLEMLVESVVSELNEVWKADTPSQIEVSLND